MFAVSVIIPCYNEEKGVRRVIESLHEALSKLDGLEYEIIAVNDGSTDRTLEELQSVPLPLLRVSDCPVNQGYGAALKRGIAKAANDWVMIIDADGTYPLEELPRMLAETKDAEMVVGARIGSSVAIPIVRRPAKWAINKLANYLSGYKIPDLNSGFRLMRKSVVSRFEQILPEGFSFTTTITLAMLTSGHTVKYVPINYAKRSGRSKIRPIADTIIFTQLIVRTIIYFRPLKVFVPLALALFIGFIVLFILRMIYGEGFLATSVMLLVSSIQVLTTGMLADLIQRRTRL